MKRCRWSRRGFLLTVLVGGLALASAPAAMAASPFAGTALWIAHVPDGATPQQLSAEAAQGNVHTLFVKAADGTQPGPQFTAAMVGGLRASGDAVCGWTFAYGADPKGEAAAAIAAANQGAQCLVIDAEGQHDKRYGAAQVFVRTLRARLGSRFPIGLAGQAEVAQHPTFPYSVFLGPHGFGYDLPQMYWVDLGITPGRAYAATLGPNAVYGRPIRPVGQLYGPPPPADLLRFRELAGAYRLGGMSFFDLEASAPDELASLAQAPPRLKHRSITLPTLRAGADGDQIVWAQELLNAAGAHLPVGGFFGAQTSRALARFQARHHLHANGVLGPATWKALLRFHAR